ncbi:unnamed protein product [Mucor hiemalis]
MMKLFKKKKSDNKLSTTMLQQENSLGSSLTIVPSTSNSSLKKPVPVRATNETMMRSYTPPTIVMPKPRRVLTPTRAILGGYDNDKTQVEDDEETGSMMQDFISPILLPTSHHGDPSLFKSTVNKNATMKQVSSSTAGSDDTSSRVYESALESSPDDHLERDDVVEDDAESEQWLPSPELSNLNNFANLVVQSPHAPSASDFKKRVPVKSSNASSATVTPPHLNKQPTPSVSHTLLKQKEEQDILLQQLKQQVELMEKQRILDREEWSKKEQELLNHRQQMMETLIETKDQLTNVLKAREENKAREAYYQKQLQQQQLLQLQQQQQLQQQKLMQQQLQQQHTASNEEEDPEEEELQVNPSQQQNHEYYQQQQQMASEDYGEERRANKMRPDDYARSYHSRSSSRASNHPSLYQQAPQEDDRKSAISRRNSNASTKSGKSGIINRCDPSPSATVVAPTPQRVYNRRRAKSIESGKWHDDPMGPPVYDASQLYYQDNRPRRSRSAGRRPSSVGYNDYYDEDDVEDDGYRYYDASPRYSGKHGYHNDYYVQQQPIYTNSDLYPGDYYSPRHPFPPLQPQQMQYHPPPPQNRQINAQRYVAQPRHYHYN